MNVQELIETLEDAPMEDEVLIASQPSYPLQFKVGDVVLNENGNVYLVEGDNPDSSPYAPAGIWRE